MVERLLTILSDNPKLGRTQLAFKARLNYGACIKYARFMKVLGWVEISGDDESNQFIAITESGKMKINAIASYVAGLKARILSDALSCNPQI